LYCRINFSTNVDDSRKSFAFFGIKKQNIRYRKILGLCSTKTHFGQMIPFFTCQSSLFFFFEGCPADWNIDWEESMGHFCAPHEMQNKNNFTLDACKELCLERPDCSGIDYSYQDLACGLTTTQICTPEKLPINTTSSFQLKGKALAPSDVTKEKLKFYLDDEFVDNLYFTNDFMWQIGTVENGDIMPTCVGAHISNPWASCDPESYVCAGRKNVTFGKPKILFFFAHIAERLSFKSFLTNIEKSFRNISVFVDLINLECI
jgi:hypothetical protein